MTAGRRKAHQAFPNPIRVSDKEQPFTDGEREPLNPSVVKHGDGADMGQAKEIPITCPET